MKKIIFLIMLFLCINLLTVAKPMVLSELNNPDTILIDKSNIYISDGINIFIYSKDKLKLIKKFGKEGAGPKEFKKIPVPWIPSIFIYLNNSKIIVNSSGKTVLFSNKGDFLKEFKTRSIIGNLSHFIPFGEKYIFPKVVRSKTNESYKYCIYNSDFKEEKELYEVKSPFSDRKKVNPLIVSKVKSFFTKYTDKGNFIIDTAKGEFIVFNQKGEKTVQISPDYKIKKINRKIKNEYDNFFKNDVRFKQIYLMGKNSIKYPDIFPNVKEYRVSNGNIFIITYIKKQNMYETLIYKTSGKFIKKVLLPLKDKDLLDLYPFNIFENKVYQIIEDEEAEEWTLTKTNIN